MIVVAIIAVLAIVVIPTFVKESKRGKAKSEVHPMFTELSTREDQYKLEKSSYLAMPACPPSAVAAGTIITGAACATTANEPWVDLRVQAPQTKLTCSYRIATGAATDDPTASTEWPAWGIAPPALATSWYFIKAVCPDTEYYTASWDSTLRAKDGQ